MLSSIRLSAGILALAGLSLALAENVLAATCAPETVESSMAADAAHGMPAGLECERPHDGGDHDHDPSCPFAPLASPDGCVAAASLPAAAMGELTLSPETSRPISSPPTRTELLLAAALFRPPRA